LGFWFWFRVLGILSTLFSSFPFASAPFLLRFSVLFLSSFSASPSSRSSFFRLLPFGFAIPDVFMYRLDEFPFFDEFFGTIPCLDYTLYFLFFYFSQETGGIGTDASLGMFFYFMSAVAITRLF
jgi:hypothetical protein